MQSEPIFILNAKLLAIERKGGYFTINSGGIRNIVKNLESIGDPFSIIIKRDINTMNPFTETPEFRELTNPVPIASTLEYYLRNAGVDTVLSKREDNLTQYLGITYGKPATIKFVSDIEDSSKKIKRNIVPCHFYLIHDNLENVVF